MGIGGGAVSLAVDLSAVESALAGYGVQSVAARRWGRAVLVAQCVGGAVLAALLVLRVAPGLRW